VSLLLDTNVEIGICALDALRRQSIERLISRKRSSFAEVVFQ